jgi:hypothetical protein
MVNAALAQGKPTIVIAMTTAAITQPSAIHKPPKTIQSRLRTRETRDIGRSDRRTTRSPALVVQPLP